MKILYYRYNLINNKKIELNNKILKRPNIPKKVFKEIEKYKKEYDVVIPIMSKSNKKLSKKLEIPRLKQITQKYNIDEIDIIGLNEEESKYIDFVKVNFIKDETKEKDISNKLSVSIKILKELYKKDISIKEDFKWFENILGHKTTFTTFSNYMNDLYKLFPNLIMKNKTTFSLRKSDDLLMEIFEKVDELEEIVFLLQSLSYEDLKGLSQHTKNFLQANKEFFLYKTRPFEEIDGDLQYTYEISKEAIKNKKYLQIEDVKGDIKKIIPLKIVFMENNWYIAGVYKNQVKFFRMNFMFNIEIKEKYPKNEIKKSYLEFLKNFKTPFTQYGAKWKKAILKIDKSIAHHFEYKTHFPYQKIVETKENEIILQIKYTQPMEVLPIIKKWLPNISIIESENDTLQKILKRDLKKALEKL